ncbi:MAG: dihydroorotate dehydrogenase [Alphaproteobacteria bacterium]|nr:dihydroorotate dehydrogenase [Alphaproteobacteria bacterium]
MVDLGVRIGSLALRNPIMPGSGTFSEELARVVDLNRLGAYVTKSVTPGFRDGNPTPRVAETPSGMLNSIGLPSKGIDHFLAKTVPFYARYAAPLVVSVSADSPEDFAMMAERVSVPGVAAIEINISCPNIEEGGHAVAMEADATYDVVSRMRVRTDWPLWAKLTPNTGSATASARAAEAAGADAVVVANTILAMAIDLETLAPKLGTGTGGLSGPAVKPVILRMVWQCAQAVRIPIIGSGGIMNATDVVEYLAAGASAVQVGTATFLYPKAMVRIVDGLAAWCTERKIARVTDLIGRALPSAAPARRAREA